MPISTGTLRERLAPVVDRARAELNEITEAQRKKIVSQVSAGQVLGGLRGAYGLVCDTSSVDPDRGLIIRGIPVGNLTERLPEEIFYLLLTGELPDEDATESIRAELRSRAGVPGYVWKILEAMPGDSHPMAMLSTGIVAMERESVFRPSYRKGMTKDAQWEPMLEDALTLLARLPELAAGIYRMHTGRGERIEPDPSLDWAGSYAAMLGLSERGGEFADLIRLYLVLHCDHEGGNVSAFTSVTVSSALSDLYYAISAGFNGLAGPLHGLANQECLRFVIEIRDHFGGVPSRDELREYCSDRLRRGLRIPGYGHAVLRDTDPRFKAFLTFGKRVCSADDIFQIVEGLFETVPKLLVEQGKSKDPWPNVDAGSGALLHHFGLTEFDYYTVLFAVSRALGLSAQAVLNRAVGAPIMRPKSITTAALRKLTSQG